MKCVGASSLKTKAGLLEEYTENFLVDTYGVLYCFINDRTQKPWTTGDFKPGDDFLKVPGFDDAEVSNYENSGMTTGAYLAAQSFKYKSTRDPVALKIAGRTFEGICHIYALGLRKEEGYFPKTYGGKYSEEASTDQYLYAMKGMMVYLDIAPPDHTRAIRSMIPRVVDFWVKRKYRRSYFGIKDMLWPLGRFPSLLIMAWKVSGEQKYLDEFYRLNEEEKVYLEPTEARIGPRLKKPWQFTEYEKSQDNKLLQRGIEECAAMDIMELDECLQHSDAYKEHWLNSIRQMWREGKLGLTSGGLARVTFLYDPADGTVSVPPPGFIEDNNPINWSFESWAGGFLTARSTMLARVGVHVAKWLPEENASSTLLQILSNIDPNQLRQYIDPDGKQLLEKHRFMCHQVSVDAVTNWLWAYWQGCCEGIITLKD
jgi:hypothetical protein